MGHASAGEFVRRMVGGGGYDLGARGRRPRAGRVASRDAQCAYRPDLRPIVDPHEHFMVMKG